MKAVVAVLVTAGAYSLAYPPFGWEALLWIALVPLLQRVERMGVGQAALAGAGFGVLIAAFIVAWIGPTLVGYYERSLLFTVGLLGVLWLTMGAPFYAAACAALAFARPRVSRLAWLLLVPCAWVAAELTRTRLGLQASWALVGDAFHEWARLRQIADVTAVYGVSFVVVLGNAVVLETLRVVREGGERRAWLCVVGAFVAVVGAAVSYGEVRRDRFAHRPDAETLDWVLVQGNVEPQLRWQRTAAARVLRRYGSLTRDAVGGGEAPDLVVWPENAIQTGLEDPVYGPPLLRMVHGLDVPLVLGAPRTETRGGERLNYNSAFLIAPGAAPDHYDKRRLMPFGESDPLGDAFDTGRRGDLDGGRWVPGTHPGIFEVDRRSIGVLICLEAIYPETVRDVVASGAEVIVNLSNDGWFQGRAGPEQHFQQTVFRSIEVRRPLVRVTTTGVTALVEPDGTVRHRLDHGERGTLRVEVRPVSGETTVYARFGDVFAGGCLAATVGSLLLAAARRR